MISDFHPNLPRLNISLQGPGQGLGSFCQHVGLWFAGFWDALGTL